MTSLYLPPEKLELACNNCKSSIQFSIEDHTDLEKVVSCNKCKKEFSFSPTILKQMKQFEDLCTQIQLSKNIFGQAAVAVDVGPHHVKIPFQLLLTRLSSVLELEIEGKKIDVAFRVDALKNKS